MIQNTCKKEECLFWGLFDGKCPQHFINTFYPNGKEDEKYEVEDCAPIRTMLMIKELHDRLIGTQKAFEEERNKMQEILKPINDFVGMVKKLEQEKRKEIDDASTI